MKALGILAIALLSIVYVLTARMDAYSQYQHATLGSVGELLASDKASNTATLTTDQGIQMQEVKFEALPGKMIDFVCTNFPKTPIRYGKLFTYEGDEKVRVFQVNFEKEAYEYKITCDEEGNLLRVNSNPI